MEQYFFPLLFFLLTGAVIGILLTVASKFLRVQTDEKQSRINEALPGANCGGCGYSGCAGYAKAVAKGEAPPDLCRPGGAKTAKAISSIMGVDVAVRKREVAYVRCNGTCDVTGDKYVYNGTKSCAAVERFYNGRGFCRSRCHGLGDCAAVCSKGCISIKNGIAAVDPRECIGCGKCIRACPNSLITLIPYDAGYMVQCMSPDDAKTTRKICRNGCLGCGLCEKKCPKGAVAVNGGHAEIDAEKCDGCGLCAIVCPVRCITEPPKCGTYDKTEEEENE